MELTIVGLDAECDGVSRPRLDAHLAPLRALEDGCPPRAPIRGRSRHARLSRRVARPLVHCASALLVARESQAPEGSTRSVAVCGYSS